MSIFLVLNFFLQTLYISYEQSLDPFAAHAQRGVKISVANDTEESCNSRNIKGAR